MPCLLAAATRIGWSYPNQAELMFKQARELAKTDDHAGALEAYLFAFDNGKAVYGWGGVRLSYIPVKSHCLARSIHQLSWRCSLGVMPESRCSLMVRPTLMFCLSGFASIDI